jgi:single-stranded DNA-specific DHH superfamily exonuclease
VRALNLLAPFGMGNAEPVLALRGQRAHPRVLDNKIPGEPGHLKLSLDSAPQVDVIGFRQAPLAALTDGLVDLAFKLSVDEYRGVRRLGLKLTGLRASQ